MSTTSQLSGHGFVEVPPNLNVSDKKLEPRCQNTGLNLMFKFHRDLLNTYTYVHVSISSQSMCRDMVWRPLVTPLITRRTRALRWGSFLHLPKQLLAFKNMTVYFFACPTSPSGFEKSPNCISNPKFVAPHNLLTLQSDAYHSILWVASFLPQPNFQVHLSSHI